MYEYDQMPLENADIPSGIKHYGDWVEIKENDADDMAKGRDVLNVHQQHIARELVSRRMVPVSAPTWYEKHHVAKRSEDGQVEYIDTLGWKQEWK